MALHSLPFVPADFWGSQASWWSADEVAQAAQVTAVNGPNVERNWPLIYAAMKVWEIQTPLVGAGIIGTIAQESGSFAPVREAWWLTEAQRNAYYADTTQHAPYGGGIQYHGRCFVQLTHVSNYQAAQDAINQQVGSSLDLVGDPDSALDAGVAAHIICWFFASKGIVPFCEQQNWSEVRRRVYGGADAVGLRKLQFAAGVLLPLARERGFA